MPTVLTSTFAGRLLLISFFFEYKGAADLSESAFAVGALIIGHLGKHNWELTVAVVWRRENLLSRRKRETKLFRDFSDFLCPKIEAKLKLIFCRWRVKMCRARRSLFYDVDRKNHRPAGKKTGSVWSNMSFRGGLLLAARARRHFFAYPPFSDICQFSSSPSSPDWPPAINFGNDLRTPHLVSLFSPIFNLRKEIGALLFPPL